MSNESKPLTEEAALFNPHAVLDPAVPNTSSSQLATDVHGRIVGTNHDERAELVPDSSRPQKSVEGFRPGDVTIADSDAE